MTTTVTEELHLTGSLLSITIFEQKLMHNFYVINNKLKKLDQINELDARVRGLEKEIKFTNMKLDTVVQKLPKDGGTISRNDVKLIARDQVYDLFNVADQKFMRTKFPQQLKREINQIREQLIMITSKKYGLSRAGNSSQLGQHGSADKSETVNNRLSLTAGQVLINDGKSKVPKQALESVLDRNQMGIVKDIMGEATILEEMNEKIQDLYRKIEEVRISKSLNSLTERELQKFEKYEHYEQKSQQKRRNSQMKLEGIKRQNLKGEHLKNELYTQMQKAELVKNQLSREGLNSRRTFLSKGGSTQTNFKDEMRRTDGIKIIEESEVDKGIKRSRSTKKMERIERRLKVDDIKDINSVMRQIQLRIEGKVSHEIFMGFIQDFEQKLEILKITKDTTSEMSEMRKMINSIQNRLQSIIAFLQNTSGQEDALVVRKQWACISCDKNLEKYGGKVGGHLNWEVLNSKKISPTKAGAFGQTAQLASKIKSLMDNSRGAE